jgi:hypothetical protein
VHLLTVTSTRHLLEFLDVAGALVTEPLEAVNGTATARDRPGVGLVSDEAAVAEARVLRQTAPSEGLERARQPAACRRSPHARRRENGTGLTFRNWHKAAVGGWSERVRSVQAFQTPTCSAIAKASSTSVPRYRSVLSILVWPSKSWVALKLPVRR